MQRPDAFRSAIDRVVSMPRDPALCDRVSQLGLQVVNVMWEDTARTPGSVWGANISDMTLQVRDPNRSDRKELLPVIRYPNFTDKTGDVPLDLVKLKVGNEKGDDLRVITLREYLSHLDQFISYPGKYHAENRELVTAKDTHVLVSAQACFLPIPLQGKCEFDPVLFNYQSRANSPAVLAILVSTEGTSATVVDNDHDRAAWGQNLYFNHQGQKTYLTGERLSDYKEGQAQAIATEQGISLDEARSQVTVAEDMNMVMIVQVPLKHKDRDYVIPFAPMAASAPTDFAGGIGISRSTSFYESDMEDAVIGHGEEEGEHLELGRHKLERDQRYPIRVTVQFYKATSNGVVDAQDLDNIRQCIEMAYSSADYIGSLVVGTLEKGELGMGEARPTQPAPSRHPILSPVKDFLKVVNPFAPHHKPKTGKKE